MISEKVGTINRSLSERAAADEESNERYDALALALEDAELTLADALWRLQDLEETA